jgi:hypothetical protein
MEELRETEAAFFGNGPAFGSGQDRIQEHHFLALVLFAAQIDHKQPKWQVHLIGSQPDPAGLIHQVKHLLYHRLELFVDAFQGFVDSAERRMWKLNDLQGWTPEQLSLAQALGYW